MIDLQAVYVREVAELTGISYGAMVRIEDIDVSGVSDVLLNGVSSEFFALTTRTLMVAIPASFMRRGLDQDVGSTAYGYVANGINNIQVIRTYTGQDGESYNQTNTIVWDEGENLASKLPAGSRKVTLDGGVIFLKGLALDNAVRVRVNNKDVSFLIRGKGEIMTVLPERDSEVHSVDVVTTAKRLHKESFFEYMLGEEFRIVRGPFKLVQQFVKVLLTTPGSDVFAPHVGGNMQNFVGQRINPNRSQTLVAKTILNVVQCGIHFSLGQMGSDVPSEERLSDVQVINAQLDPADPTMMYLSIKLNTLAGRSAFFSMIVSESMELAQTVQDSGVPELL